MTQDDTTPSAAKPKRRIWGFIFILVLLAGLGFGGYRSWQCWQQYRAQQQQAFTTLQQQITVLKNQTQQQSQQIEKFNQSPKTLLLWRSQEIAYSVHLAQLAQTLKADNQLSLAALLEAEKLLKPIRDTRVKALRSSLQTAIDKIQQQPSIDIARVLKQLSDLSQQVSKLPLGPVTTRAPETTSQKQCDAAQSQAGWRDHWQRSVCELKKLVVIRHWKTPVKPLLAPGQRLFVEQNLQVLFEETKFAALRTDTALYQQLLQQTQTLIQRYFATEESTTRALLDALQRLQQQPIRPEPVDLSAIESALTDLQQQLDL